MASEHLPQVPVHLEQVVAGMDELGIVLGAAARAVLPAVRTSLVEAMAARDRGDPVASLAAIGAAMNQLALLADRLDPQEAALMRTVAGRFRAALLRGNEAEAKQGLDTMLERSGAVERKRN